VSALKAIGAQATAVVQRALNTVASAITSWSDDADRQALINQLSS